MPIPTGKTRVACAQCNTRYHVATKNRRVKLRPVKPVHWTRPLLFIMGLFAVLVVVVVVVVRSLPGDAAVPTATLAVVVAPKDIPTSTLPPTWTPTLTLTPKPTRTPRPTATPRPTRTELPTVAVPLGSRTNPIPAGDEGKLADWGALQVLDVTRPADDIISRASGLNEDPLPSFEYMMAEISITCLDETYGCDLEWDASFDLIGLAGREYKEADVMVPEPIPLEFEAGETVSGWAAWAVPITEEKLLMRVGDSWAFPENYLFMALP